MINKDIIKEFLKGIPTEWQDKLTILLQQISDAKSNVTCDDVRECETVTSLSEFTVDGSQISITYTDEDSVAIERTFDLDQVLSNQLEDIDPGCLTDDTTWSNLSYQDKIQLLITSHCDCCS